MEDQEFYINEYRSEKERTAVLEDKISTARRELNAVSDRLERIKGSKLWAISKPARDVLHLMQRTKQRLGAYGSLRGIMRKVDSKMQERAARFSHGTRSFPDEARRKAEEETVFEKNIIFSILVPLYNTPKSIWMT